MVHRHAVFDTARRLVVVAGMIATAHGILAAQDSVHEIYSHLFSRFYQDSSVYNFLVAGNGDTIRPEWISASYTFSMRYDSVCEMEYLFTECRRNQEPIRLATWEDGRRIDTGAPISGFNSSTIPITCRAGDTLSFYRELSWRHPVTGLQDTGNYYAPEALGFSVELVRLSDSTRVALLDTLGIMPSLNPGKPVIHGTRPLLAVVRYIVPREVEGTRGFIRIRAGNREGGVCRLARYDGMTINISARVDDSRWESFINLFDQGEATHAMPEPATMAATDMITITL